jgi:hypothetical protein
MENKIVSLFTPKINSVPFMDKAGEQNKNKIIF